MMRRNRKHLVLLVLAALIITTMVLGLVTNFARAESSLPAGVISEVNHMALTQSGDRIAVAVASAVRYTGTGPSPEFSVPIPENSANFEAMSGGVRQDGSRVIVPAGAITAGKSVEIGFRYTVPASVRSIPFVDIPPSPVAMVLVDEATLTLIPDGANLVDMGVIALGQHAYHQFDLKLKEPGSTTPINVKLGGDPENARKALAESRTTAGAASAPTGSDDSKLLNRTFHGGNANVMVWQRMTGSTGHGGLVGILLLGLAGVGLIALALILINQRRQAAVVAGAADAPADDTRPLRADDVTTDWAEIGRLEQRRAALAQRIADLDRKAVETPSEEVEELRSLLKQQLVQVILRLRQLNAHAG